MEKCLKTAKLLEKLFEIIGEIIIDTCLNTLGGISFIDEDLFLKDLIIFSISTGVETKYKKLFKQGEIKCNVSYCTEGIFVANSVAIKIPKWKWANL